MQPSNTLIAALKRFEGFHSKAYCCPAGVWTIGYGHNRNVRQGQTVTESQAEAFLRNDIANAAAYANTLHGVKTQGQFDAVVDFIYNCGITNFNNSTLKRYIVAGRPAADIQAQFLRWNKANGKVLAGLTKRRQWEADRWAE